MVNGHWEPVVGDRVLVPWGLDEVEGEVVEVYGTGLGPRVKVRLADDAEGATVTLPLDSLSRVTERRDSATAPGGMDYERLVGAALRLAATELNLRVESTPSDVPADLQFSLGKRRVLVEVKHFAGRGSVSTDTVLTVAGLADRRTAVLLVADVPLAASAKQRLEQLWRGESRVWFVQWRGSADDKALRAAFSRLLLNWPRTALG